MARTNTAPKDDQTVGSVTDDDMIDSVLEFTESVEDAERPEPLPVGTYPAQITAAVRYTNPNNGNQSAKITLEISGDDMPADYVTKYQVEKKTFNTYRPIVKDDPQSRYNLKVLCQSLRLPVPTRSFDLNSLVGASCKLEVKHGKDLEGQPREEAGRMLKN